ncbi:MAG: adenosylcobinamide amidohydrolase [Dehalococcoidales bacterium]
MSENMKDKIQGEFHGIRVEVINHQVWGAPANALIINLPEASDALSSREGFKKIKTICNCYLPRSTWGKFEAHPDNWNSYLKAVLNEARLTADEVTALSTGVNMDNVTWQEEAFEELWVTALVTAGVTSNAMRVGKDKASTIERDGLFNKPGTINTILITGAQLDLTALSASFITITEAKNIALQELDIRSTYNPEWQATGTGTDQIVVVSGKGKKCTYVGGHTKMGELMAQAVTSATIRAIKKGFEISD